MRRIFALILCLALTVLPVRAEEPTKYIALTFDDGPSGRFTAALLDGLEARGVRATFLLCGYRAADYPDLVQRIFDGGHEIGLHGYSHGCMAKMSREQIDRELSDTLALLPEGCCPAFLRPPGGQTGDAVRQAAQALGLGILSWSVDPKDWATSDENAVERAVLKNVRDGDIILLHDMSFSSVHAALTIIDSLREQGYEFITVSELAQRRGTPILPGQEYRRFP